MRGLPILIASAALLSLTIVATAQETVTYYGFSFPPSIGGMTRGKITEFEKTHPGIGYGISYAGESTRIDIFVYDLGRKSVSWDVFSKDQKDEFDASVRTIHLAKERGIYRNLVEREEFETPAVKNPFFRCKAFSIERGEGRIEGSVMCLGGRNDKFFKTRITFSNEVQDIADRSDKIMREISRATKF